ncbi:Kinesin-like protein KIF22 [Acropora cervicornis]|uniref:Kinesin-like protein KIF22 n=1 Tax=Acropora cervicornis TaxID=6130 RepID=A0AAD9V5U0_ACRCE|nr:Kinesin-like protein KIF22 [Acropora cervicornis]
MLVNVSSTLVRDEQRKLEDRLTALEKLAQKNSPSSTDKNTTCKQLPKEISNRQPNQVSSPSRIARSPLKDLGNSSSTQEIIYIKDSPQSKDIFVITPHSERKSGFTVDENYKVKINSSVKETHNKEILSVLNNGSIKDLKKLQGVGEKRAQLIVDWRNAHGPFQQIHDLKYISGFTDNMVSTFLKDRQTLKKADHLGVWSPVENFCSRWLMFIDNTCGGVFESSVSRDRFVRKLKHKGNRKQFVRNTEIDAILQNIQAASDSEVVKTLADDARAKIKGRQKLLRIPDQGKDGRRVFDDESDKPVSRSEDAKRLRKAREKASRQRRTEREPGSKERGLKSNVSTSDQSSCTN